MRKPQLVARPKVSRPRIAPMPVLPIFYKLQGQTVLLAGGSQDAFWKAELLLAAGAKIRLCAVELVPDFASFIENNQTIEFLAREWKEADFVGVALAVGGFEGEADARAFAKAAKKAGVPVNTIDQPNTCAFQFGSIVNRAPVVISVSTNGAAPILGQAIRQKIETLLPLSIIKWAAKAASMRTTIAQTIPDAAKRRTFWRRFADEAFTNNTDDVDFRIKSLMAEQQQNQGKVFLVGAGPGAADLLTLRAMRALQSADVILFDDLVSDDILELARREAKRITVGKRGGRASCCQRDIDETMIKLAKQGRRVVRLKSGDPMVFGRAGEEIESLEAAGIEVEVVPGITASSAAASSLKKSLTHRDCAQGVKFVTGHSRKGELPDLDWRACADPETTLMVYMGAGTAGLLAAKLLAEGLSPDLPVVVVRNVSRDNEQIMPMTLAALQSFKREKTAPTLIGIGTVFKDLNTVNQLKENKFLEHACPASDYSNKNRRVELDVAAQ